MKIVTEPWDSRVNFVEEDGDCFVGYDLGTVCCEDPGWYFADRVSDGHHECMGFDEDFTGYHFDRDFFQEVPTEWADGGAVIAFRLVKDGAPDLYLHLFNVQNGYYSHGFEMGADSGTLREGTL